MKDPPNLREKPLESSSMEDSTMATLVGEHVLTSMT